MPFHRKRSPSPGACRPVLAENSPPDCSPGARTHCGGEAQNVDAAQKLPHVNGEVPAKRGIGRPNRLTECRWTVPICKETGKQDMTFWNTPLKNDAE